MDISKYVIACFIAGSVSVASAADVAPADVVFTDDTMVENSLTGAAGDAVRGREIFSNRKQGNCLACHVNEQIPELGFHGEVGPPIDGVADRYSVSEMRAILVDSKKALSEDTIMPGFYSLDLGIRVLKKFSGKTVLTASQVEDVLAYLTTLKE
ncbi:MAG: sulfur oxidation c-type cytochrome SoxX [Cohaesibacteraceae bacterium]|nr:sulfur oxidation c-type cytochrome SoxX [Cohaesibacteraceae bacterium]MBL4876990.1 sulfur oxidation c-type cytochrome SoxX [Cohaesibacteraceae bacterium]